jgi:hypothetical protein
MCQFMQNSLPRAGKPRSIAGGNMHRGESYVPGRATVKQ